MNLNRISLTVKMTVITVFVSLAVSAVGSHLLDKNLQKLLHAQLTDRLSRRAVDNRRVFDKYYLGYHQFVKLFTALPGFTNYVSKVKRDNSTKPVITKEAPPWIPPPSVLRVFPKFDYALLFDPQGNLRELFQNSAKSPTPGLLKPSHSILQMTYNQTFQTSIDDKLFILASEVVKDSSGNTIATLMVAHHIDSKLLDEIFGNVGQSTVALVAGKNLKVLASNKPDLLRQGDSLEDLKDNYTFIGKSFLDYGDAENTIMFASLISNEDIDKLSTDIRHKSKMISMTAAFFMICSFLLIMIHIVKRIIRLNRGITEFSQQIGLNLGQFAGISDQLTSLEFRFRRLFEEIIFSRNALLEASQELQNSEKSIRAIMENMPDGMIAIDNNKTITMFNRSAEQIFGYNVSEVIGLSFMKLLSDEFEGIHDSISSFEHRTETFEMSGKRKDGNVFPIDINTNIVDFLGKPMTIVMVRDITRRKLYEDEIKRTKEELELKVQERTYELIQTNSKLTMEILERKRSEEQNRAILSTSLDGFVMCDMEGRFINVNDAFCKMIGYEREELLQMKVADIEASKTPEAIISEIERIKVIGGVRFESKQRRKDGNIINVEVSINIISEENILFAFIRDITQRVLLEERNNAIFSTSLDGFVMTDLYGSFIFVNDAYCKMTGYTREELLKMFVSDIEILNTQNDTRQDISNIIKMGGGRLDGKLRAKDGTIIYVEASINILNVEKILFAFIRDITQRVYLEEENRRHYDIQRVTSAILSISMEPIPFEHQLEQVIDLILNIEWLALESKGCIFLADEGAVEVLEMKANRGLSHEIMTLCKWVPFGTCICGRAAVAKEIIFTDCIDDQHDITYEGVGPHGHYCVPILSSDRSVMGIINLYVKEGHKQEKTEMEFLGAVSNTLAGIIERMRTQKNLELSQTLFQSFMSKSPMMAFIKDENGRYVFVNDKFNRVTHHKENEVIGKSDFDIFPADTATAMRAHDSMAIAVEKTVDTMENIPEPDGIHQWLIIKFPYKDITGRRLLAGMGIDTTEHKRVEETLKKSEEKYLNIINSTSEGFIEINKSMQVVRVNDSTCAMVKATFNEIRDKGILYFIDKEYREEYVELIRDLMGGSGVASDLTLRATDGALIHTRINATPVKDATGAVTGAFALISDITEIIDMKDSVTRYAAELQRSNQDLQDFANVASHDLQEPLRKIVAFGERLREVSADTLTTDALDYLNRMDSAAERMQQLIDDLLNFSRITTRAKPFTRTEISKIVEDIKTDLEVRLMKSKGKIEAASLCVVDADRFQLQQLLTNLIANGLKFHRDGVPPVVRVSSVSSADGLCRIRVEDNGVGFDMKYVDKIFKPFQRLHSKSQYEGTGMGLAICEKIVQRHGGTISVDSALGKGTVFTITLPIVHEKVDERESEEQK
ncbi:MAG: PAS domain S-box protein [Nitrospirae bacterium]|nr:PAS domain S-box protein [Nitrospirota bacterium]MBF0535377.1 PAS domain S-box protein [Nitrospirota bacterium]MBF0616897.1 PAS domain S-box protein [Nitrospirota bacterium]